MTLVDHGVFSNVNNSNPSKYEMIKMLRKFLVKLTFHRKQFAVSQSSIKKSFFVVTSCFKTISRIGNISFCAIFSWKVDAPLANFPREEWIETKSGRIITRLIPVLISTQKRFWITFPMKTKLRNYQPGNFFDFMFPTVSSTFWFGIFKSLSFALQIQLRVLRAEDWRCRP